jgi:hypothetical protein
LNASSPAGGTPTALCWSAVVSQTYMQRVVHVINGRQSTLLRSSFAPSMFYFVRTHSGLLKVDHLCLEEGGGC